MIDMATHLKFRLFPPQDADVTMAERFIKTAGSMFIGQVSRLNHLLDLS
jgi:hypothetical protein